MLALNSNSHVRGHMHVVAGHMHARSAGLCWAVSSQFLFIRCSRYRRQSAGSAHRPDTSSKVSCAWKKKGRRFPLNGRQKVQQVQINSSSYHGRASIVVRRRINLPLFTSVAAVFIPVIILPACRPRRLAFGSLQSLVIYCCRPIP